ncbi:hypothetical protein [Micromonospora sp. NPDC049679]|uniref:hypothetical protein n=1 Tax=Micromonospora sp. NPDC049679 TaxID=3155920 RepID=UPI00340B5962
MDETGQPGSAAPGDNGNGPGPEDRVRPGTGWAAADAAWSGAGAPLGPGPDPVTSPWRQAEPGASRGWADPPSRYADLLGPPPVPETRQGSNGVAHDRVQPDGRRPAPPAPASAPPYPYEGDLEDAARDLAMPLTDPPPTDPSTPGPAAPGRAPSDAESARHAYDAPTLPGAANGMPPARWRDTPPPVPSRALPAVPAPGAVPAAADQPTPIGREVPPEFRVQPGSERPVYKRPADVKRSENRGGDSEWAPSDWRTNRPADPAPGYDDASRTQPPFDGAESGHPAPAPSGYDNTPAYSGYREAQPGATPLGPVGPVPDPDDTLPQRVPAEPDVPTVPEPPAVEPPAETPELARIATHLRREDVPPRPPERPDGFDVKAILAAVRGVAGVRDASLRTTPAGAHSLRLDLADGADPADVSRLVARLLQERMGLDAAPQNLPGAGSDEPTGGSYVPEQTKPRRRAESGYPEVAAETPRRRRQAAHRGRAGVAETGEISAATSGWAPDLPEAGAAAGVIGTVSGNPVTAAASYSGGQLTTTEAAPSRPLDTGGRPGPRVVIDHVQVSTFGMDATVEVRLAAGRQRAGGVATGPAVDGYILRLCAASAASAIDELLATAEKTTERGRCFVEHAALVPFGSCEVATVVVLLVCDGWVEQLVGSALVAGDPRQAAVRATLAAVNRRLEALLA